MGELDGKVALITGAGSSLVTGVVLPVDAGLTAVQD